MEKIYDGVRLIITSRSILVSECKKRLLQRLLGIICAFLSRNAYFLKNFQVLNSILLEVSCGLPAKFTEIFIQKVTISIFFSKNMIFSSMLFKSGQHVLASVYGSCDTSLKSLLWVRGRKGGRKHMSNNVFIPAS